MKNLTTKKIREQWISFFEKKGHLAIPSKSLIPVNDPSLLWINSGVATLKDYFSGIKIPPQPKLVNSQKSIRTNDIENVGVTARHHTFFEMLGNFSIGDYFKSQAIEMALEFLVDVLEMDLSNIYMTYFEEDLDTYNKWIELGISPDHLIKGNREMNFWDVGQGPCGPDTEIFYDRGEKYDPKNIGIKLLKEDLENDRYVEIWNIVFSQFNNDGDNNYTELKQKNIDTGAGLERIASILQDGPTNFDTDGFMPIINEIEKLTSKKYITQNYFDQDPTQTKVNKNFKVIADHMRAVVMAIQDGAKPSNAARGYIIRRLIRRAYRSGLQLGINQDTFLNTLVDVVSSVLSIYEVDAAKVSKTIINEELAFQKTIKQGEVLLNESIKGKKELPFGVAFKLFETYGFPIELTQEILEEKGIALDISKFDEYQKNHANASRGKTQAAMKSQISVIQEVDKKISTFSGFDNLNIKSKVVFSGTENEMFYILTEETPFYATGGGQANDHGSINGIKVEDVFKDKFGNNWHVLLEDVSGDVELKVDSDIRKDKERNHSATHLLAKALKEVVSQSVVQLGSDNNELRLRFDFPAEQKPSKEDVEKVEALVNSYISKGSKRSYVVTDLKSAEELGAVSMEGEEYGDVIRVVNFENVSLEFCGGTHVGNASEIETFKITKLETKGSGIYRIEAITSNRLVHAYEAMEQQKLQEELKRLIKKNVQLESNYKLDFKTTVEELTKAISQAKADNKKLNKKSKQATLNVDDVELDMIDGKQTYINMEVDPSQVKPMAIALREKYSEALIIVAGTIGPKKLVAVASNKYNSLEELKSRFPDVQGGGSDTFAMGKI